MFSETYFSQSLAVNWESSWPIHYVGDSQVKHQASPTGQNLNTSRELTVLALLPLAMLLPLSPPCWSADFLSDVLFVVKGVLIEIAVTLGHVHKSHTSGIHTSLQDHLSFWKPDLKLNQMKQKTFI